MSTSTLSRTVSQPSRQTHPALSLLPQTHGAIFGQTGSGKSTLARVLLAGCKGSRQRVITDPKLDFRAPGPSKDWKIIRRPEKLSRELNRGNDVIYRPGPECQSLSDWEEVYYAIFTCSSRADLLSYTDEAAMVAKSSVSYPTYYGALYQQGRALGIQAISGTQRPANVPRVIFSECGQFWGFRLLLLDDRKRRAEYMGEWQDPNTGMIYSTVDNPQDRHGFYYRSVFDDYARLCVLEL